jgi:hypothetical protein
MLLSSGENPGLITSREYAFLNQNGVFQFHTSVDDILTSTDALISLPPNSLFFQLVLYQVFSSEDQVLDVELWNFHSQQNKFVAPSRSSQIAKIPITKGTTQQKNTIIHIPRCTSNTFAISFRASSGNIFALRYVGLFLSEFKLELTASISSHTTARVSIGNDFILSTAIQWDQYSGSLWSANQRSVIGKCSGRYLVSYRLTLSVRCSFDSQDSTVAVGITNSQGVLIPNSGVLVSLNNHNKTVTASNSFILDYHAEQELQLRALTKKKFINDPVFTGWMSSTRSRSSSSDSSSSDLPSLDENEEFKTQNSPSDVPINQTPFSHFEEAMALLIIQHL